MITLQSEQDMMSGIRYLNAADSDLAVLIEKDGCPPLWQRQAGFPSLVHIILEQQVSLASAQAAFDKLNETIPELTPATFLSLSDTELRTVGFSRQKTRYVRLLAESIENGKLPIMSLSEMTDSQARDMLTQVTGIGNWTADIYLLMVLGRPDIWPVGDLALVKSVQNLKQLTTRPDAEQMVALAESWRPWRSVAARVLWNHYLIRLTTRSGTN